MSRPFLDTNVLVYAFGTDPRGEVAHGLLAGDCVTGVQNLNEFANVARGKLRFGWSEVREALEQIETLCDVTEPIDRALSRRGMDLAERYGFSLFDGLVVAAALEAGCDTLWSEDMHDGLAVENVLTIRNPFAGQDG